jgi:hypothetical protein
MAAFIAGTLNGNDGGGSALLDGPLGTSRFSGRVAGLCGSYGGKLRGGPDGASGAEVPPAGPGSGTPM